MPIQKAHHLISHHLSLSSLAEAARWRAEADAILDALEEAEISSQNRIREIAQKAPELRLAAKVERPFLGLFFKSLAEKSARGERTSLQSMSQLCRSLAAQLQDRVADTPATTVEHAHILRELKATKKQLQFKKKEVSVEMKDIRASARQESADVSRFADDKKYTKDKRQRIRDNKESSLTRHENARGALDHQILLVEKKILRIESYR